MNLPRIIDMARRREPMSGVVQSEAIVALADEVAKLRTALCGAAVIADVSGEEIRRLKQRIAELEGDP